jgi:Flp pilus assembly protein TadD
VLDNGLKAVGDHPALLEKALACAMMLNDPEGGCGYVERELKVVPKHEQGWLNLAHLSLMTENLDRSEKAARELLKINPRNWEAWLHLGNLFDAIPDEAKAEAAYRKALELAPDNWKVLMNFAAALVQTKNAAKHAEAKKVLLKAKGLVPQGEWRVHYNLALAHVRLGETKEALALAKEIQKSARPDDAIALEAKKLESNLLEKN